MDENEKYVDLRLESRFMESVSHDIKNFGENAHVEPRVKGVKSIGIFIDVGEYFLEEGEPEISVGAEFVAERPDHAVQDGVEEVLGEREEAVEVEPDQGFEEGEEVGPDFGETVEVAGDQRQARSEDHVDHFAQKLAAQHPAKLLQHHREQGHELLVLGLGGAVLEVAEEFAEGEDEGAEHVVRVVQVEGVGVLERAGVDLDDLAPDVAHGLDGHEVEHVLALLRDRLRDLHGVVEVDFVHGLA